MSIQSNASQIEQVVLPAVRDLGGPLMVLNLIKQG